MKPFIEQLFAGCTEKKRLSSSQTKCESAPNVEAVSATNSSPPTSFSHPSLAYPQLLIPLDIYMTGSFLADLNFNSLRLQELLIFRANSKEGSILRRGSLRTQRISGCRYSP